MNADADAEGGERILVIKHGAMGDFVLAMGPFAAIRDHHADARITLLTTPPFAALGAASPYFDAVWTDSRPGFRRLGALLALRRRLRDGRFDRVYDLQTSDRSSLYFRFFGDPKPQWSGVARGCSHFHDNPRRDFMHTVERQAEQLAIAGIDGVWPPDLNWMRGDVARFHLPQRFSLLVPGGATHRPDKRWPAQRFADLADVLTRRGAPPALIGAAADRAAIDGIKAACPLAHNLCGHTSFGDIAALAREACVAVGNDTGPMHLITASACPSVVLFSAASDPELCAPRGPNTVILRRDPLAELDAAEVAEQLHLR